MAAFDGPTTASTLQRTADGDISPLSTANPSSDQPNAANASTSVSRPSYSDAVGGTTSVRNRPNPVRTRWSFRSRPGPRGALTADHAILIDSSMFPYSNKDYIDAIKLATNPAQIHSFSRIQGCFQLYFKDVSWSRQLIANGLTMPDARLIQCHPLGVPPVRVVVSDVPSHFDNGALRDMMSVYGTVVGPIKSLRASYQDPDLPNLQSFRRQVMMKFPTGTARDTLPSRLFVDFDDVPLTFFVSTDMRCHRCQGTGHVRDNCPARAETPSGGVPAPSLGVEAVPTGDPSGAKADSPAPATSVPPLDLSAISAIASDASVSALLDPPGFPGPGTYASSVATDRAVFTEPAAPTSPGAKTSGMVVLTKKRVSPSETLQAQQCKLAKASSRASSLRSQAEDSADDMDFDASTSHATPLSDSSLASLFDAMYRSSEPILVHVRQHSNDPVALLAQLKALRADKEKFKASCLSRFTTQAVYQYERKIRKALLAEHSPSQ